MSLRGRGRLLPVAAAVVNAVSEDTSRRDERPLPSDQAIRKALAGWLPPMPFTVVMEYEPGARRPPDRLWVSAFAELQGGRTHYLAVGPVGRPVPQGLIRSITWTGMPKGAGVQVLMGHDLGGRTVFQSAQQILN